MRNKRNQPSLYISKQVGGGWLCFFSYQGEKKEQAGREAKEKKKKSTSGMRKENRNRRSCMEGRRNK